MSAFCLPRSSTNENDQASIGMLRGQIQKIISITRQHQHFVFSRIIEHFLICRFGVDHIAQLNRFVSFILKHPGNFGWDIVI